MTFLTSVTTFSHVFVVVLYVGRGSDVKLHGFNTPVLSRHSNGRDS